jgi:hypothetical protein
MYAVSVKLLAPKELVDIGMINYLHQVSVAIQELIDIDIQRYLLGHRSSRLLHLFSYIVQKLGIG